MRAVHGKIALLIDGRRTADDIARTLAPAVAPHETFAALGTLASAGLLQGHAQEADTPVRWSDAGRALPRLLALLDGPVEALVALAFEACPVFVCAAIPARGAACSSPDGDPDRGEPDRSTARAVGAWRAASGRGFTRPQAIASCLGEAAEAASAFFRGDEPLVRARAKDLGPAMVDPDRLLLISQRQYARRSEWNRTHGDYDWIPPPFDEAGEIEWVKARSLDGETVFLPAACCYSGYRERSTGRCVRACDSNGCASGPTPEDAVVAAFLELVERDAVAMWWYGRHRRPPVALEGCDDAGILELVAWMRGRGRQVHLLDLTTDLAVPVVAAITADARGRDIACGFAAHFSPRAAIGAALSEAVQLELSRAMARERLRRDPTAEAQGSIRALLTWSAGASLASESYLRPAGAPSTTLSRCANDAPSGTQVCLDRCRSIAERHRLTPIVVDLARADIGVPTARLVVPGLRHLRGRFAAGRLYDVPVRLGWIERALSEEELNPTPMFI